MENWKEVYFSFNSLTLAPTELSWSSSLFFLLSVFLRFLDTHKTKKVILCVCVYSSWRVCLWVWLRPRPLVHWRAWGLYGSRLIETKSAKQENLILPNKCNMFMNIDYDHTVVLEKLIQIILRCFLEWCLCVCVCSYSCSPACSLSSGSILSRTWEYWTLALTQAARGAAAALARFAFWP